MLFTRYFFIILLLYFFALYVSYLFCFSYRPLTALCKDSWGGGGGNSIVRYAARTVCEKFVNTHIRK